jgi:AraC family transcriptional regulator, regulatory protein of adaptative response / methylphosphotriester-DNA alkyltransferase methyltransferase
MQRPLTIQTRTSLLRDALDLMEAEYARDLQLDDIARRIATSRRQLQRCFDEHSDVTFRQCLTRIRLARAAELLTETQLPVREIARRVGYRQPAQFAKAFHRHYGLPPMRFRGAGGLEAQMAGAQMAGAA